MTNNHNLFARTETIIWGTLEAKDYFVKLSVREALTTAVVALVREAQSEAFNEGRVAQIMHDVRLSDAEWAGTEPPAGPPNPYQQEPNND